MTGALAIRDLRDDERDWANALYRAIQFAVTPPEAVALVVEIDPKGVDPLPAGGAGRAPPPRLASLVDGARVGLGRLVPLAPDVLELGGIWTDEAVRGRGIARAMVNALLARRAQGGAGRLWCIPFAHLSAFYQSCGFAVSAPPWPPAIAAKVADCVAHALPEVVVLAR